MKNLFLGPLTLDANFEPLANADRNGDKIDCRVKLRPGGGPSNACLSDRLAGGNSLLAGITGGDVLGDVLESQLRSVGIQFERISTADRTRVSAIVTTDDKTTIYTRRSVIDHDATFRAVEPLLKEVDRLVLASFAAADAPLLHKLIDNFDGPVVMMPTSSQIQEPESTLRIARKCWLLALNQYELKQLTGVEDPVEAIERLLTEHDVPNVFCTAGLSGIYAHMDGHFAHHQAFDVPTAGTPAKCGDFAVGSYLRFHSARPLGEAVRLAAAAGAMQAAGVAYTTSWDVEHFAATTPTRGFIPPIITQQVPARWKKAIQYASTAAAVLLLLTLWQLTV